MDFQWCDGPQMLEWVNTFRSPMKNHRNVESISFPRVNLVLRLPFTQEQDPGILELLRQDGFIDPEGSRTTALDLEVLILTAAA